VASFHAELCTDSKRELWVGPRTTQSPDGFMFDQPLIDLLIQGTDLLAIFKAVLRNLQRLDRELALTANIWWTTHDYGAYENAVCPAHTCPL
jgi:hypothetical protein